MLFGWVVLLWAGDRKVIKVSGAASIVRSVGYSGTIQHHLAVFFILNDIEFCWAAWRLGGAVIVTGDISKKGSVASAHFAVATSAGTVDAGKEEVDCTSFWQ